MRNELAVTAALVLGAATLPAHAACFRCGPIQNVTEVPVPSPGGKALSNEDVKKAIMRAGGTLGWKIDDAGPGKMTGTLNVRTHTAVVEIPNRRRPTASITRAA
ncbi:MAG TPA: hypothetical protein VEC19_11605 [Usitatibacter sp.]|nr:hypothetical protein [Usitatibacter sp.]